MERWGAGERKNRAWERGVIVRRHEGSIGILNILCFCY